MPGQDADGYERTVCENERRSKPQLDMLIENFDRALSHPDKADLEKLQKSVLR